MGRNAPSSTMTMRRSCQHRKCDDSMASIDSCSPAQLRSSQQLSQVGREGDAASAALANELGSCDEEIGRARLAVQGLWTSRRMLIDEIKVLR